MLSYLRERKLATYLPNPTHHLGLFWELAVAGGSRLYQVCVEMSAGRIRAGI